MLNGVQSVQDEMIAYVRRKSAAFSRGRSKYRGVSGQAGRWEARIGAYCGRKNVRCLTHREHASFNYLCCVLVISQVALGHTAALQT